MKPSFDIKIVGTNTFGYAQKRNFVDLPFQKYKFQKVYDLYKVAHFIHYKWRKSAKYYYNYSFQDFSLNNINHLHFFNNISFGKTPWLVTFEDTLPRWGHISKRKEKRGIQLLADDPCKKLIAFSDRAFKNQLLVLSEYPEYEDVIKQKMMVLHPGQKTNISSYEEKELDENHITFTFVGNFFFLKGGMEVLRVMDHFLQQNTPVKLNIISTMLYGDHASRTTESDYQAAMKIIHKYPNDIRLYSNLSNAAVLEIFKRSHVGLLPSYDDTYGYSVLEAQANACPVITTDVRSFPEINNNECGWMIEVPKRETGKAYFNTTDFRSALSKKIEGDLYDIVYQILNDRYLIMEKGQKAFKRIKIEHSIIDKSTILERLYDKIQK